MTSTPSAAPSRRRRRRRLLGAARSIAFGVALAGAGLATSSPAHAAIPQVLKPPPESKQTMQFLFGLGPSSRVGGRGWDGYDCRGGYCGYSGGYGGAFKLHQEFMFHFTGKWHGPGLSLVTQQEFAGYYFGLNILPRFAWDIWVYKPLALLISPFVGLGYHLSRWSPYWYNQYWGAYGRSTLHSATLQFGVTAKLMLAQRWMVWLQFPSADVHLGPGRYYCGALNCPTYVHARFDVLAGGGITF